MPTYYTTQAHVEARLSALGVSLRVDDVADDPDALAAVVAEMCEHATQEVAFYVGRLYSEAALAASRWVIQKATAVAAWWLCGRRANPIPKSVQALYEKAIADLEKVAAGTMQIPGAPMRKQGAPVLSQPRALLYPVPRTVIERNRSTGDPQGYPRRDDPVEPPLN